MVSLRGQLLMVIALGVLLCSPIASWAQRSRKQGSAPELASREQSLELAGVPFGQVVVIYEHPELTIKSHGASLMDVLRSVCGQIGAELDGPSLPDDVVLGIIGPGPVRDVLATMFTGSPYEVSTNGAPEDPSRVARVIVVPRDSKEKEPKNTSRETSEKSDSFSAAGQPTNMPEADTSADLVDPAEKPSMQQTLEVLKQAKAELAQATDSDAGEMAKLLDEVEAQIKSGAIKDTQSSQPVIVQRGASPPGRHHGRH
jgi:hypothetical protein